MAIIIPGILTNNEAVYVKRLNMAAHSSHLVQIDVVDGLFSKNKTVGVNVIKKYQPSCLLEIQLMVVQPQKFVEELVDINFISKIIFPLESGEDEGQLIYRIKKAGKDVGISLNPDTKITDARIFFNNINLLLLMTGKPGYSGQVLGESTYDRIREAKELAPGLPLEVDIGVNFENAAKLAHCGANFLVASSALFGSDDFSVAYEKLAKLAAGSQ